MDFALGSGEDDEMFDDSVDELKAALTDLAGALCAHVYDDEQSEPEP